MAANILLVEDEPGIQELLKFNLAQAGHQVTAAGDAEHALTFLKNTLPDVILLDWMLPGMSGIDLCRRLRQDERYQPIPIIMLTARGEERDKVMGSTPAPTTTSPSRSRRANWCRASRPCYAV